jgi:putative peptide zinc metalloprotease protein
MEINYHSKIKLHPFEIRKEKKFFIIEDQTTEEFYEMPEICVVAMHKISEGFGLEDIERELKAEYPQEDVNIIEFVEQLLELELVEEVDGEKIETGFRKNEKEKLAWVSPKFANLFFNKTAIIGYCILFLLNILLFILKPQLFPRYKDVFVFDYMFQNIILWFVLGGFLILVHELGHILAIRAHGLPTKLEVGHRLFLLVLETDLSLGWKLPSKNRILLYLAGLGFDQVILFVALLTPLLFPEAPEIFISVMAFVVFHVVVRFIYQCCVYLKTDLYYVLENVTGCHNLMENAKGFIFNRKKEVTVFEGEKRIIYMFSVFYIIGLLMTVLLFFFYYFPQVVYTLLKVTPGLKSPINSVEFLDSVFVIIQVVIVLGLLIYSWSKKYSRKSQKQTEWTESI